MNRIKKIRNRKGMRYRSATVKIPLLAWPLDRILHAEIWATDTIPADLPPMIEFKAKADAIILERRGITVEHIRAKDTFESGFYRKREDNDIIYGFPMLKKCRWCSALKVRPLHKTAKDYIHYLGIAVDEPKRFHNLKNTQKSPLVSANWTETDCWKWCEKNHLLSPIYSSETRGGCWFCPCQPIHALRLLRRNYPAYWMLLLHWDANSPVCFRPDGHTVADFDRRFQLEDERFLSPDDPRFRWNMLDQQLNYRLFLDQPEYGWPKGETSREKLATLRETISHSKA